VAAGSASLLGHTILEKNPRHPLGRKLVGSRATVDIVGKESSLASPGNGTSIPLSISNYTSEHLTTISVVQKIYCRIIE
jgi:hypothetical protein